MIRKIVLTALFALGAAWIPANASADEALPVESSLTTEPAAVTWPSSSDFQYRLSVRSGPEGADFRFHFPVRPWGPADVSGTPFTSGKVTLEGPGDLKLESALVADPSPISCYRGAFGSSLNFYRLSLEPNSQTVVTMPSRLIAAPVSEMDSKVEAVISGNGSATTLEAPLEINGKIGVRIIGGAVGGNRFSQLNRRAGRPFRIAGRTVPVLKNRAISFRAEPRLWSGNGTPPESRALTTVRTDSDGRFRTDPLRLGKEASWVLTSRLSEPGSFDDSASCNGTVHIEPRLVRARVALLDGKTFISGSIRGSGLKPKKIELSFFRGKVYDENFKVVDKNGPIMGLDAGCNKIGGGYKVRSGRLRWIGPITGTTMACPDDRTGWISKRLTKGVKAELEGQNLILRGKRGFRIVLKPRR